MGTSTSTLEENNADKDKLLRKAGPQLTQQEGQAVKKTFIAISGKEDRPVFEEAHLQEYFRGPKLRLPKDCITSLFNALVGEDKAKFAQLIRNDYPQQSFYYFVQHVCHLLKGTLSEKAERTYLFCSRNSTPLMKSALKVSISDLIQAFIESKCVAAVYPHISVFPHDSQSDDRLSKYLTNSLPDATISKEEFENWMSRTELGQKIFDIVFAFCFYLEVLPSGENTQEAASKSLSAIPTDILSALGVDTKTGAGTVSTDRLLVPMKLIHPLIRENFEANLLDLSSLMFLNNFLPTEVRGKLYPLFSSSHHGESFSMFCKQLVAAQGPTLIVVQDTDGNVFGGFAAEKWQYGPKFKGNANCFLFSLAPEMGVYVPSGYNDNYMYLEHNAQTLPNGLGMGGQIEYFGLWLSGDYGTGHSRARPKCTTYNSPRLSQEEEFKVQLLEVWGVGDPVLPTEDEEDGSGKPSILDKDKVAGTLLEMAGKKLYSKDIREAPDES